MRFLDQDVAKAAREHAMRDWPRESCGVVTPSGYVPLENVSTDPEHAFDCVAAFAEHQVAETALALIHSHPGGPDYPTKDDMIQQIAMDLPWGIVTAWGTDSAKQPWFWGPGCYQPVFDAAGGLIIRQFRHGPSGTDGKGDCFAAIMDWFRQMRGIELREQPRDWKWWKQGETLYERDFAEWGFVQIDGQSAQEGDVFLCALQSNGILNHGGVYLGDGTILHHCEHRLMCRETLGSLGNSPSMWLRYRGS